MLFASIASLVIFFAAGGLLVFAAFHSESIAGWENRSLLSMADAVARLRTSLEAKQALAEAAPAASNSTGAIEISVVTAQQQKKSKHGRAA